MRNLPSLSMPALLLGLCLGSVACSETFVVAGGEGGVDGAGAMTALGGAGVGGTASGAGPGTGVGGSGGAGVPDAPVGCVLRDPGCVVDWAGVFGMPVPFTNLLGVAVAPTKVYVSHANQVSVIDIPTGEVSPLAGTGSEGDDVGLGPAARFNTPSGLALHDGFLYVSVRPTGAGIAKIKRIDVATGLVTDYIANNSLLKEPRGLAIEKTDGGARLLIVDAGNHSVVRVGIAAVAPAPALIAGTHATAGDGPENLSGPTDIVVREGRAFVADRGNKKIRSLDLSIAPTAGSPIPLEDVWGSGVAGFADGSGAEALLDGPSSLAFLGDELVVGDAGNFVIRAGVPGGALGTIVGVPGEREHRIGGGRNAGFDADVLPLAAREASGELFILESQVVRRRSSVR